MLQKYVTCHDTAAQDIDMNSTIRIISLTPMPPHLLSLTLVNHLCRPEYLSVLMSGLDFEFTDCTALNNFCKFTSPEWRNSIASVSLEHIEGQSHLPLEGAVDFLNDAFPKLRIVHLSVQPRNPRFARSLVPGWDWEWGPQTKELLENIAYVKAKILLMAR